jgi:TonB family protein
MPEAAIASGNARRGARPRTALVLSLFAHVALLVALYNVTPPTMRQAAMERIIPIFVAPRPVVRPPPAVVTAEPQRTANPGGRSGQGSDTPAIPVRQPEQVLQPERVLEVPPARNVQPDASSLISSAGEGRVQGDGAGNQRGAGPGEGSGIGSGVGQGTGPGGVPRAPAGWVPKWRKMPTREQVNGVYPKAAWDRGVSGGATLLCTLTVSGRVRDCEVIREAPPGQGFGQAVLMLSRHFRIEPRRENGRAVETRLAIPYLLLMDPAVEPQPRSDRMFSAPSALQPGPVEAPVVRK